MRKSLFLFSVFLFLVCTVRVKAQSCDELSRWLEAVIKEYPQLDHSQVRSGSAEYNNIRFNLLSDGFFSPFYGQPFDELNASKRNKLAKKIMSCRNRKNQESVSKLYFYLMNAFVEGPAYAEAVNEVIDIRALRIHYPVVMEEVRAGNMTFQEYHNFQASLNQRFKQLLPAEIQRMRETTNLVGVVIADRELWQQAESLDTLSDSREALRKMEDFRHTHDQYYQSASPRTIARIDELLTSRSKETVKKLAKELKKELAETDFRNKDIYEINEMVERMRAELVGYVELDAASNLLDFYREKKTAFVSAEVSGLIDRVNMASEVSQLHTISHNYFSYLNTTPEVEALSRAIASRKSHLESIAEAKREANERIVRKKADNEKRISELRKTIRDKYGDNPPSVEVLNVVLTLNNNLITGTSGKYDKSKADQFIRELRSINYRRVNTGNLTDIESFVNDKGYKIRLYNLDERESAFKDSYLSFDIENPIPEIMELYRLELATYYRRPNKSTQDYFDLDPNSSKRYVSMGGSRVMSINVEKNQFTLRIHVNGDLFYNIMAYRFVENLDMLTVTPFTNTTDLYINKGDVVSLTATGNVYINRMKALVYSYEPDGNKNMYITEYPVYKQFKYGALLGKVGEGPWFEVGKSFSFEAERSGQLHLMINDKDVLDNSGNFEVRYTIR